jgi:hypothetical protein
MARKKRTHIARLPLDTTPQLMPAPERALQSNAALMSAIEVAYDAVRHNHPELPPAIFVLSPTSRSGRNTKLGHFFGESWLDRDEYETAKGILSEDIEAVDEARTVMHSRFHEILISAEGLDRGGREVMETVLHEAAHALALARGIKDVTGYQYHNRNFKVHAEELGLQVEKFKNRGFAYTQMTDYASELYADQIELLDSHVTAVRKPTPKISKNSAGQVKMACACGNIIRAGKRVAANASILCEDCNHHFHPVDRVDLQRQSLRWED